MSGQLQSRALAKQQLNDLKELNEELARHQRIDTGRKEQPILALPRSVAITETKPETEIEDARREEDSSHASNAKLNAFLVCCDGLDDRRLVKRALRLVRSQDHGLNAAQLGSKILGRLLNILPRSATDASSDVKVHKPSNSVSAENEMLLVGDAPTVVGIKA